MMSTAQFFQISTSFITLDHIRRRLPELAVQSEFLRYAPPKIILRLLILKEFNQILKDVIPLIDLGRTSLSAPDTECDTIAQKLGRFIR